MPLKLYNISLFFSSSGGCVDVSRLVPPFSPFLCWPPHKEEKKEIKQSTALQPAEAKEADDEEPPYPTCPFPEEFYKTGVWDTREKQKFDWDEGGDVCPYMEAPVYSENEGVRASIGGAVGKVINKRPRRLLPGDFIAFASGERGYAFYVAQILKIRVHSIWVHFFGDKFLGMT